MRNTGYHIAFGRFLCRGCGFRLVKQFAKLEMKKISCWLMNRKRRCTPILKIFSSEAFVNIIIELLEIDIQELFLGEELAKQFPESLLVFISYQMHDSGAIVESI